MRAHRWCIWLLPVARSMIVFSSQGLIFPVGSCIALGIIPDVADVPDEQPGALAAGRVVHESVAPAHQPRLTGLAPA